MRTDFKSIPTMDYGRCISHLPFSDTLTLILISVLMITELSAACISEVRVSLNGNGEAHLSADMFVTSNAGNYTLELLDSPLSDKTFVDCSFRGTSVIVELINSVTGITCWSTLYVDDKSDYTVITTDTLINCLFSMDSIEYSELISIEDNCYEFDDFTITYNDILDSVVTTSIDTFKSFTRIWGLKDPDGNKRTVTSKIFLSRFNFDDIAVPTSDTVYCPQSALDLSLAVVPSYFNLDLNEFCGVLQSTAILDSVTQGCDANVKYRRLWIFTDWDRDTMVIDTQTIFRIDTTTKSFEIPNLSYSDITDSCMFSFVVPTPDISGLGCTSVPMEYTNAYVNGSSVAIGDSIILEYGDFTLGYSGRDDCFNPIDLQVDSLSFNGLGLPVLSCTNIKTVSISLTDSVMERSVRVSALYTPNNILGCIDALLLGRRIIDGCNGDSTFSGTIDFCIADTSSVVTIEIIAEDSLGNRSIEVCNLEVQVSFKNEPVTPVFPTCVTSVDLYISAVDSMAMIDPNQLIQTRGNISYTSLTGSGSSASSTGSGFMFGGMFSSFDSIGNLTGDFSFDCNDLGTYNLDLSLADTISSNIFNCEIDLNLIDSSGICTGSGMITGNVYAWGTHPLNNVQVNAFNSSELITHVATDQKGSFDIENVSGIQTIQLEYSDDWYTHLSSNDLYYLEQIVTGVKEPSNDQMLTADINGNGQVDGLDFITLKKLLMGYELAMIYEESPWKFYNSLSNCSQLSMCQSDMIPANKGKELIINGIKRGDIDGDVINELESRGIVELVMKRDTKSYHDKNGIELNLGTSKLSKRTTSMQIELYIPNASNILVNDSTVTYHYSNDILRLIMLPKNISLADDIVIGVRYDDESVPDIQSIELNETFDNLIYSDFGKSSIVLTSITEQHDVAESIDFTIFPNPSLGLSRIKIDANESKQEVILLSIYNELGELVNNGLYQPNYTDHAITLPAHLSRGVYNIVVQQGEKIVAKKFIKL